MASYSEPYNSVAKAQDLRIGGHWFDPRLCQYFFPRIDDSHCDSIHSSLYVVHYFDNGYAGKQPVVWKNIVQCIA